MDLGMKGKTAIVLAASKGLGKAIAEKLAEEGVNVVIASRDEQALQKTAEDIQAITDSKILFKKCDIKQANDIKALVEYTIEHFNTIDILVNNAGGPPAGNFDDIDDENWQHAFELNLLSFVRAIRSVLPYMRKNGGRILNIASSSFKQPIDGLILSNTFRTGIVGLSKSLSQELAKDKILINTLGPGTIETDRVLELSQVQAEKQGVPIEEILQRGEKSIPLGRYGQPEEFAKMAVFLCSDANSYVTGQAFLVDGGKVSAL